MGTVAPKGKQLRTTLLCRWTAVASSICEPLHHQEPTFMNNNDLADHVASEGGLTKADARKLVDSVFAAIADAAS